MTLVQPSGDMSAKIREELREPDAESVTKDIAAIREWLEKQPHLPKDMGKRLNDLRQKKRRLMMTQPKIYRRRSIENVFARLQVQLRESEAEAGHVLHDAQRDSRVLLQSRHQPTGVGRDHGHRGHAATSRTHAERLPRGLSSCCRSREHAEQRCRWNEVGAHDW